MTTGTIRLATNVTPPELFTFDESVALLRAVALATPDATDAQYMAACAWANEARLMQAMLDLVLAGEANIDATDPDSISFIKAAAEAQ
jgi:hypothetical protein